MKLFGRKKKESAARVRDVLAGEDPPVLPQGIVQLLRLLRDPDSEVAEIAKALEWNPGLVVGVLRTVNSAATGLRRKVDSVPHAVSLMGRAQLEHLVLGVAVQNTLPTPATRGFEAPRFWHMAFFRACLGRALAERLHPATKSLSFTGGLLQDLAVPLLVQARTDTYDPVLARWHADPNSELQVLERETLGWSHDEVGADLANAWELPEPLIHIIAHQHDHAGASDEELLPAMRLVSFLRETECEHGFAALLEVADERYGLAADDVRELLNDCDAQARELAQAIA